MWPCRFSYRVEECLNRTNVIVGYDRWLAERAIADGVLRDIQGDHLDTERGIITVRCPDCDKTEEARTHFQQYIKGRCCCGRVREHAIALNGGSLVLSPTSPLASMEPFAVPFLLANSHGISSRLIRIAAPVIRFASRAVRQDFPAMANVRAAIEMKGIRTVGLFIHAPCGAARFAGMGLLDQLRHLALAKRRLKLMRMFAGVKFPCFVQIDFGPPPGQDGAPHKMRTYHVSCRDLVPWLKIRSGRGLIRVK